MHHSDKQAHGTFRLFGQDFRVTRGQGGYWIHANCRWFQYRWNEIPAALSFEGKPLIVALRDPEGNFAQLCRTRSELVDAVERITKPNTVRLREIERTHEELDKHFRECEADPRLLRLHFEWKGGTRRQWQSEQLVDGVKVVYVPERTDYPPTIWAGRTYRCEVVRELVNQSASAGRPGFKLVAVRFRGEHISPADEITRLKAAIVAGKL